MMEVIIAAAKNLTDEQIITHLGERITKYKESPTEENKRMLETFCIMLLTKDATRGQTTEAAIRDFGAATTINSAFKEK